MSTWRSTPKGRKDIELVATVSNAIDSSGEALYPFDETPERYQRMVEQTSALIEVLEDYSRTP